jgi:nucleoside-diphosphate-sugar epimerase
VKPGDRVAVIGGGGFIGRHLVHRLREDGAAVRIIGLGNGTGHDADLVRCDVGDRDGLRAALAGTDLVYNLAAAHGDERDGADLLARVNVDGARNVCAAATDAGVHAMVFVSSAAVYGNGDHPDESARLAPRGGYGITKLEAEHICRAWAGADAGRALVIVRPTVVFGPGGTGTGARLLRHLAGPGFRHAGKGDNRKSLAFVANVAAFLAFVRSSPAGIHLFNYADQPDLAVAEIAAIIRSALGMPAATRRSRMLALAGTVGAEARARLTGGSATDARATRTTMRALGRAMTFNADRAHGTGFRAPVDLRDALATTARTDARWVAWLTRAEA